MVKKYKKYIIPLIIVLIILGIFLIVRGVKNHSLENTLSDTMREYYDDFANKFNIKVDAGEKETFTLKDIEDIGIDIKQYKEKKCDLNKSKLVLTFKKDSYDIKTKLVCKKY